MNPLEPWMKLFNSAEPLADEIADLDVTANCISCAGLSNFPPTYRNLHGQGMGVDRMIILKRS